MEGLTPKNVLNTALLASAVFGGWTASRLKLVVSDLKSTARTFSGGAVKGGSALIPGCNTGLVLFGIPQLWSYAWIAFIVISATMCCAIWLSRFLTTSPEAMHRRGRHLSPAGDASTMERTRSPPASGRVSKKKESGQGGMTVVFAE